MADPSFSQWIKEEVAVKLRILFESLVDEKIVPDLVTAFVMSPASGISPYVYWVRDHAVPSAAQIAPPPPSQPSTSLSNRGGVALEALLEAHGVRWTGSAYVTSGFLGEDAWGKLNTECRRYGYRWSKEAKGWVRQ